MGKKDYLESFFNPATIRDSASRAASYSVGHSSSALTCGTSLLCSPEDSSSAAGGSGLLVLPPVRPPSPFVALRSDYGRSATQQVVGRVLASARFSRSVVLALRLGLGSAAVLDFFFANHLALSYIRLYVLWIYF